MGKLSDILRNGSGDKLRDAWASTEAAGEFEPLPSGTYMARIVASELFNGRTKATPGLKITFRVLEGEHVGRQFWLDLWLTPAAIPMTKRDLARIGIVELSQLERPMPKGIRCLAKVALRIADDGTKFNVVKHFDVVGIDPPNLDPFAPKEPPSDPPSASSLPSPGTERSEGDGEAAQSDSAGKPF